MKLAVSNIAWDASENEEIMDTLKKYGVQGIELAPTKRWSEPEKAAEDEILDYRKYWTDMGINPVAMQSLLFNREHLKIFGDSRSETITYLKSIIRLAGLLGTRAMVFGSPRNRTIGDSDKTLRYGEAVDLFRLLGEEALRHGVVVCIEPNPVVYNCDFITTTNEGLQFVRDVNQEGVRLHLDTGTMLLNNEVPKDTLTTCLAYSEHFHISDPYLLIPGSQQYSHSDIAQALREANYEGWISIEMKGNNLPSNKEALIQALEYVNRVYLNRSNVEE